MSCYEWEKGSLKIPAGDWKSLKDSIREAYNQWIEVAYQEDLKTCTSFPATKNQKPTKRAKANTRTHEYSFNDGVIIFSDDSTKTVTWIVNENNHAVNYAWESFIGKAFRLALSRISWASKTGGYFTGNNEYNTDNQNFGGGSNYITVRYGGIGERARESRTKLTTTASISDDDLCSSCSFCDYKPGEESSCDVDFRNALFDLDNYIVECGDYNKFKTMPICNE